MRITAAVARQDEQVFSIEEVSLDPPRADEILVQIAGVGLCHTDLVFQAGAGGFPLPAVLGHEGAGTVVAIGEAVTKVSPGERVAITFRSCGECDRCLAGDAAYCRTMTSLNYRGCRTDGTTSIRSGEEAVGSNFFGQSSFATFALTYERNVVKIPDDLPIELMGSLGCGVQTGFGAVLRSLDVRPGSSILILGGGAVGLSAVMGAAVRACETVIVVEPHVERRKLALEFGATHVIDPTASPDLVAAVRSIVAQGVDYAFDTTGIPTVLRQTPQCLGSKGVFGMVGICPPGTPLPGDVIQTITFGHTIKGIIEGDSNPDEFIPEMIEHYRAGRLPFDRMIKTYPLSAINQAIADVHNGACVKAVMIPEG